ncbi:MAG: hypothetical protein PUJ01_12445, partial [Parabacteroides sp.]|nr:hypothetical protein [Parabacteroides sp.]
MSGDSSNGLIELGTNSSHLKINYEEGDTYTHLNSQYLYLNGHEGLYLNSDRESIFMNAGYDVQVNAGDYIDLNAGSEASISVSDGASTMLIDDSATEIRVANNLSSFALQSDLTETIINNGAASTYLDTEKAETIVNHGEASFALHSVDGGSTNFAVNIGHFTADIPLSQMVFNRSGLTLHSRDSYNQITFTTQNSSTGATEGMLNLFVRKESRDIVDGRSINRGTALVVEDSGKRQIAFYGESGRITGVFFQPESMSSVNGGIIQGRGAITIANNGQTTANSNSLIDRISQNRDTAAIAINTYMDDSFIHPYVSHRYDNRYNYFRVDPAFISVMNDIKITSRGGARLSEALPNYILKGIYELSNSYGAGGWPCSRGTEGQENCSFSVPYYSKKALGLSSGGWEFNCGEKDNGAESSHPITAGGGKCSGLKGDPGKAYQDFTSSEKRVTFSYDRNKDGGIYDINEYYECPENTFCWAHPFMGMVPAPGRWVKYSVKNKSDETLYAQDEGVCPDGYQAVITVTPAVFELGKVQFVNSEKRPYNASVSYNPGWQNYASANIADVTGLMQMSTKLGLVVDQIKIGSTNFLAGWRVAMGTVTPVSTDINSDGYIWNA